MSKMTTIVLGGGVGKHFAFSALLPKIHEKYGEVNILSAYPDIFEDQAGVRRSLDHQIPFGYDDYFRGNDIIWLEPYRENLIFQKKIHLIEGFARQLDLKYEPDRDFPVYPPINSTHIDELNRQLQEKNVKHYIVVQFYGGTSPLSQQKKLETMRKNYPTEQAIEFITEFRRKYPTIGILNFGLQSELKIEGCLDCAGLPYILFPHVLKKAVTFVAIDSCLQHMSAIAGVRKQGIVLWGASSPKVFGYDHNINLEGNCPFDDQHCSRPYFTMGTSDLTSNRKGWSCKTGECMQFSPNLILEHIDEMLGYEEYEEKKADLEDEIKKVEQINKEREVE